MTTRYKIMATASIIVAISITIIAFFWITQKPPLEKVAQIALEAVDITRVPGWRMDEFDVALAAFKRSCATIKQRDPSAPFNPLENIKGIDETLYLNGKNKDWQHICDMAQRHEKPAREFFETAFSAFKVHVPVEARTEEMIFPSKLTGYFEPVYTASDVKTTTYTAPVLARPADLLEINLGDFRENLKGIQLRGKQDGNRVVPYPDHEQIAKRGAPAEILAWMDPNDLLFMQIQGSGKLQYNGEEKRVGYADKNGHPYTAIGRPLVSMGEIAYDELSMQTIREWLFNASAEDAHRIRTMNKSYVFFRPLDALPNPELGPLGAQGVQLTPTRSLAVDRRFYGMGMPIFVVPEENEDHPSRLMIAQDTGGAIKGPIRGDSYIGSGPEAGEIAGRLNLRVTFYILLPKKLARRIAR